MKVFVCCSKHFYSKLPPILEKLEQLGHESTLPNSYHEPFKEEDMKLAGAKEHNEWKAGMIRLQAEKVAANDAILVVNFEKNGIQNYIGGATFLEIFQAFERKKKIFLYNPVPEGIFKDELDGMEPIVINGALEKIK